MDVVSPDLTPAEQERLLKLCQECGEVIQAATKAMMYGWAPFFNGVQYNNRADLEMELGDVQNVVSLMKRRDDLSIGAIYGYADAKRGRMMAHMRYQYEDEPLLPEQEEPELITYFR